MTNFSENVPSPLVPPIAPNEIVVITDIKDAWKMYLHFFSTQQKLSQ